MEYHLSDVLTKRVRKVGNALRENNMGYYYAETVEEARNLVESLLKEGETVATGGSVTLEQCGIMKLLRNGRYNFLDRDAVSLEKRETIYRQAFSSDTYLCSANAITEHGELYNVDGNGNRVACITYGPRQVIVVAGYNKIVRDIPTAIERVKSVSAPANASRLNCNTYCNQMGECTSMLKDLASMCDGCSSDSRICCSYLVTARQRIKDRIKVIIVGEELGY